MGPIPGKFDAKEMKYKIAIFFVVNYDWKYFSRSGDSFIRKFVKMGDKRQVHDWPENNGQRLNTGHLIHDQLGKLRTTRNSFVFDINGYKGEAMNPKPFTTIALCLFASSVFPAPNQAHSICKTTSNSEKFVVKLSKDHQAKFCTLNSYIKFGIDCDEGDDYYFPNLIWENIVDLNHDGNYDLILSNTSAGLWRGRKVYVIFLDCGNNTYVKITPYLNFAALRPKSTNVLNAWMQLEAIRLTEIDNQNDEFTSEYVILDFDLSSFVYIEKNASNKEDIYFEADGEKPAPSDFNIEWNVFPTNISRNSTLK
jgi:hypothetical protein